MIYIITFRHRYIYCIGIYNYIIVPIFRTQLFLTLCLNNNFWGVISTDKIYKDVLLIFIHPCIRVTMISAAL